MLVKSVVACYNKCRKKRPMTASFRIIRYILFITVHWSEWAVISFCLSRVNIRLQRPTTRSHPLPSSHSPPFGGKIPPQDCSCPGRFRYSISDDAQKSKQRHYRQSHRLQSKNRREIFYCHRYKRADDKTYKVKRGCRRTDSDSSTEH